MSWFAAVFVAYPPSAIAFELPSVEVFGPMRIEKSSASPVLSTESPLPAFCPMKIEFEAVAAASPAC